MRKSVNQIPAAIYARYSTEKQDARSTDDQIRRCRRYAEENGLKIVEVYDDKAVSGSHAIRADLQRMLKGCPPARRQPVRCGLGRRPIATRARSRNGVAPHLRRPAAPRREGRRSARPAAPPTRPGARLTFGVTALMNDSFLEMVRTETHRGMEGRALTGFATGGKAFGYDTMKEPNPQDPYYPRSIIVINKDEAKLLRRIFKMWNNGDSYKTIAFTFNEERIPAPHDSGNGNKGNRGWVPTTIRAMLLNDCYVGKLTWNKTKWIKDRTTGKRRNVPNPPEEWVASTAPTFASSMMTCSRTRRAAFRSVRRVRGGRRVRTPSGTRCARACFAAASAAAP